ncbi:MAG: hypothetical protein BJ554DRAFT_7645, partial [Olpidium bornovanus]
SDGREDFYKPDRTRIGAFRQRRSKVSASAPTDHPPPPSRPALTRSERPVSPFLRSLITGANTQLAAAARGSNLPETRLYLFKKYAREFSGADLVLLFTEYTYADEAYEEVGKAGAPAGAPEAPRPPEVDVAVVEVDGEFAIPAGASLEGISGYYRVSVVARAGRIALPPSACSTILTVLSQTPHTAKLLDTGTRRRESKIKSGTKSSSRVSSQLQRLLEELAAAPAAVPRPAVDDFRGPAPKIGEFAEPTGTNEDEDDDDDMTEDDEPMHCGGGLAIPVAASLPSPPPRPIAPARVVAALARKRELMRADEKERERRIVEDFAAAAQHFRAKQLSILREHERTAVAQAAEAPAGGRRAEVDPKGERRFPQPALPATGAETGGKKFARKKRERRAKHCPAKSRDLAEKNASRARRVEPAECAAPGADRAANVPSAAPPDLPACFGPRAEPPFVPSTDLPEQASNSAFPPLGRLSAVFLPNPSIQSTTQPEPGSREYVLFSRADYIARHAVSAPVSSGTTPMCSPPPPLTSAPYAGGLWPPASPAATAAYPAAPLPVSAPFAFQPLQLCEERARTAGGMPPLLPPFARPAWYAADGAADAPTKPPPYAAAFSGMSAQPVPPPQQPPGSASLDPPGGMACGKSVPRFLDGYGSMSFKLAFGGCPNEPAGDASLAGRAAQRPLGAGRCEAQFGEAAGCGESMALWVGHARPVDGLGSFSAAIFRFFIFTFFFFFGFHRFSNALYPNLAVTAHGISAAAMAVNAMLASKERSTDIASTPKTGERGILARSQHLNPHAGSPSCLRAAPEAHPRSVRWPAPGYWGSQLCTAVVGDSVILVVREPDSGVKAKRTRRLIPPRCSPPVRRRIRRNFFRPGKRRRTFPGRRRPAVAGRRAAATGWGPSPAASRSRGGERRPAVSFPRRRSEVLLGILPAPRLPALPFPRRPARANTASAPGTWWVLVAGRLVRRPPAAVLASKPGVFGAIAVPAAHRATAGPRRTCVRDVLVDGSGGEGVSAAAAAAAGRHADGPRPSSPIGSAVGLVALVK